MAAATTPLPISSLDEDCEFHLRDNRPTRGAAPRHLSHQSTAPGGSLLNGAVMGMEMDKGSEPHLPEEANMQLPRGASSSAAPLGSTLPHTVNQHIEVRAVQQDIEASPQEPPRARRRCAAEKSPTPTLMELDAPHDLPAPGQVQIQFVSQSRPRFTCPLCPTRSWAGWTALSDHIERFHLAALAPCSEGIPDIFPPEFLNDADRRVCRTCLLLAPRSGRCRRCKGECDTRRRERLASPPTAPADTLEAWRCFLATPFGGLRYIPLAAQNVWCGTLASVLSAFTNDPSEHNVLSVLLFSRVTLASCGRAGQRHNRQSGSIILDRVRRWQCGDIAGLIEDAVSARRPTLPRQAARSSRSGTAESEFPGFSDSTRRAIRRAIQDRALSKAAKIALSEQLELFTGAEEALKRLHPAGNPVVCSVDSSFEVNFEPEEIAAAIKSFPPGSSGGPSGLRASHLVCPDSSTRGRLHSALASFASAFASGGLPLYCRVLCQARIIALPKKPTGVRPIAIGETLRRIVAKCLVARFQPEAVEKLTPVQLGVGVSGAAEVIVHHFTYWRRGITPDNTDNSEAVLLVDFSNAFNTLDRGVMLSAIKKVCPQFFNYAVFCYGAPTALVGDGFSLWSARGTQQGDACGPLFFSVSVQGLAEQTARCVRSSKWYMDDGALIGTLPALQAAFDAIVAEAPRLGLSLNVSKCVLYGPNNEFPQRAGAFASVPVTPWVEGITLLGAPIGSDSFVRDFVDKKVSSLENSLVRLSGLHCPHSTSLILRSCLGACKVTYLLRVVNLQHGRFLAGAISSLLRGAWSDLCGAPVNPASWALATLPIRLGGLGVLDPAEFVDFAALTSFLSAALSSSTSGVSLPNLPGELFDSLLSAREAAPSLARLLLDALSSPADLGVVGHSKIVRSFTSQSDWMHEAHSIRATRWDLDASDRMSTLRQLFCGANAGKWLTAPPKPGGFLDPHEWQLLLRWRLGLPVSPMGPCPCCHAPMDPLGDHALSCAAAGIYSRHNAVRDFLSRSLADAGLSNTLEVALPDTNLRPADVFVPSGWGPHPVAFDVSVVHPLRLSSRPGIVTAGSAAQERAEAKRAYYREGCRSAGWDFSPCVVETTGAWGSTAQASINKVIRRIAVSSGIPVKHVAADIWTDASVVIARSVGASLARCAPQAGSSFSVSTYAHISFSNSVSATRGSIHLPQPPVSISHANPPSGSPLFSHQPYSPSTPMSPVQPYHQATSGHLSDAMLVDDPRGLGLGASDHPPNQRMPAPVRPAAVMSLPSGEVHPLRPPASRAHVASNAELGLRDPPGPVSLLACERAGARVDLRA